MNGNAGTRPKVAVLMAVSRGTLSAGTRTDCRRWYRPSCMLGILVVLLVQIFLIQITIAQSISDLQKGFHLIHDSVITHKPIIRSTFDVYLIDGDLVWIKDSCSIKDIEIDKFFVHIIPVDKDELSEDRKEYGFENLDFSFYDRGIMFSGKCLIGPIPLPDFKISSISVGQYAPEDAGPVWEGKYVVFRKIHTHLYALEVEKIQIEEFRSRGGAIENMGDDLLLATPTGRLAVITSEGAVEYLSGTVPMNFELWKNRDDREIPTFRRLRVADILVQDRSADQFDLFVTHHYYDGECVSFRLSQNTIQRKMDPRQDLSLGSWRTIFDAKPCFTSRFDPHHAGGKILPDGQNHLLVIIGDHGQDGWSKGDRFILSDDLSSDMGKLVSIEIETGKAEILTVGHRNPQGLARDEDGNLWSVEHGPQGGDELNLLKTGGNYGWPRVTYGIEYGGRIPAPDWIEGERIGSHDGFVSPVFAFVPSIGIASIAVNDGKLFPLWRDDLLITSMAEEPGRALFRVRRDGQDVKYVEKIRIGERIRDIVYMSDGRIALLADSASVLFLNRSNDYCRDMESQRDRSVYAVHCRFDTGDTAVADGGQSSESTGVTQRNTMESSGPGSQLFDLHCGSCHRLNNGEHDIGPHLTDVIGRRAGEVRGYFNFSSAMRSLDIVWTRDNLVKFLVSPVSLAQGTTMPASGVTEAEAHAIVDFLSQGSP